MMKCCQDQSSLVKPLKSVCHSVKDEMLPGPGPVCHSVKDEMLPEPGLVSTRQAFKLYIKFFNDLLKPETKFLFFIVTSINICYGIFNLGK